MRESKLLEHQKRFQKGYEGILKCLKSTEATQDELSKKAP